MSTIGRPVCLLAACGLALAAATAAVAAETSFWRAETFDDFDAGTPDGTAILEDGTIVLSYTFEETAIPDAQYVWAAAAHDGDLYAVAGTPGRVYRVRGSDVTLLFQADTADLPAMAVTPDGRVFVGTAPGGEVYEVHPDGSDELFFDTGQGYVWAMAFSSEHFLVVGTGDSATVFVIDGEGRGEIAHRSSEASVSAVASLGGRLLAGTAVGGTLLDVTPGSDLAVLHDSRYDEVTGIAQGADGSIYFSATNVLLDEAFGGGDSDTGVGEGSVFRTTGTGGVVELFHTPDAPLTCLGRGPDGAVWAGIGSRGRIMSVGPRGRVALLADLEQEEVLSISSSEDGAVVTCGVGGSIYRTGPGPGATGSFLSDVFDARSTARWGELSWRAETPGGSGLRLATRSGNTAMPDEAWSDWAQVEGEAEGPVASPPARFLQWRADFSAGLGGRGPILRGVEIAFLRENLPPVISALVVYESSEARLEGAGGFVDDPVTQTLPSGLEVTYSLPQAAAPPRDLPILTRGLRTAEWEARDPNGDVLSFDVWVRGEDEEAWKLLAEDLEGTAHTWDTQSMPDGRYRLKVRADDGPENPPDRAGSDERESAPFVVDNTPPSFTGVRVSRADGVLQIEGRAVDRLSQIVRVEVALDYGEWRAAFADDGMLDSLEEPFGLAVAGQGEGEHAVSIRALDRAGNVGTARQVVR